MKLPCGLTTPPRRMRSLQKLVERPHRCISASHEACTVPGSMCTQKAISWPADGHAQGRTLVPLRPWDQCRSGVHCSERHTSCVCHIQVFHAFHTYTTTPSGELSPVSCVSDARQTDAPGSIAGQLLSRNGSHRPQEMSEHSRSLGQTQPSFHTSPLISGGPLVRVMQSGSRYCALKQVTLVTARKPTFDLNNVYSCTSAIRNSDKFPSASTYQGTRSVTPLLLCISALTSHRYPTHLPLLLQSLSPLHLSRGTLIRVCYPHLSLPSLRPHFDHVLLRTIITE